MVTDKRKRFNESIAQITCNKISNQCSKKEEQTSSKVSKDETTIGKGLNELLKVFELSRR